MVIALVIGAVVLWLIVLVLSSMLRNAAKSADSLAKGLKASEPTLKRWTEKLNELGKRKL